MKITIYTVTSCQFSSQEKEYLKAHSLPFEEKNLETNKDFLKEMLDVSNNFAGTPVTKIEKDDGQIVVLKGFTKEEFDQTLNLNATDHQQKPVAEPVQEPSTPPVPKPVPDQPEPSVPTPPAMPEPEIVPDKQAMAPTAPPASPVEPPVPTSTPSMPSMPSVPEPIPAPGVSQTPPVVPPIPEPTVPEPEIVPETPISTEAAVSPAQSSADSAQSPAAAAPAKNPDALDAILNDLQAKVAQQTPAPTSQPPAAN